LEPDAEDKDRPSWPSMTCIRLAAELTIDCDSSKHYSSQSQRLHFIIIIIIIIKRKLKAQINRKMSQMRRDDAATENCRLQCRPFIHTSVLN